MKSRVLCLMSLAMVVCLAPALQAQEQERQRGRRGQGRPAFGRGGFGMGMGMGMGGATNGAAELLGLLRMEEVRKEVGMEESTWEAIQAQQPRPDFQAMRDLPREEIREAVEKMREEWQEFAEGAQDLLDEVLLPEKQERLMGLLIQQRGYMAATNDLIAKQIGLDEAGIDKVQEAAGEARREAFQNMRQDRSGDEQDDDEGGRGRGGRRGRGNFDPEQMREAMAQMQEKTNEAIAKVLTPEQVAQLDEMKGAKFDFPAPAFGRRGPGGPGRGFGRPPGGGRRGGGRP